MSPLPTPSLPARDTRITRNEPIPFPATSRPTPPAISRVGDLVAWDRYAVPSSDVLERLIRDAGRRDDDDQQQSGAAHHASRRHPRRVKR